MALDEAWYDAQLEKRNAQEDRRYGDRLLDVLAAHFRVPRALLRTSISSYDYPGPPPWAQRQQRALFVGSAIQLQRNGLGQRRTAALLRRSSDAVARDVTTLSELSHRARGGAPDAIATLRSLDQDMDAVESLLGLSNRLDEPPSPMPCPSITPPTLQKLAGVLPPLISGAVGLQPSGMFSTAKDPSRRIVRSRAQARRLAADVLVQGLGLEAKEAHRVIPELSADRISDELQLLDWTRSKTNARKSLDSVATKLAEALYNNLAPAQKRQVAARKRWRLATWELSHTTADPDTPLTKQKLAARVPSSSTQTLARAVRYSQSGLDR